MKPYRFSVLEARLDDLKYEIIDELSWISGCRRDLVVRRIRGVKLWLRPPRTGALVALLSGSAGPGTRDRGEFGSSQA